MTRVIIGHRFAELGKVIGDPWRHRRSSMAFRRGRIIPVKVSGETFSILDLSRRSIYVGRLREIGEITRPIVVNMSLVTDRPTASLESVIDFAISRASSLSPLPGIQGLTGWAGQVHFLKSFPPVRPAGPRNGPSRLGVGSSRMSSRETPTRALSRISVPGRFRPAARTRCAGRRSVLSRAASPRPFAHFRREVISASASLASPRFGGTAGRRGGLYLLNGGRLQQI